MEPIDMIKRELQNKHITNTALAKMLKMGPTSVFGMLQRKTLQVNKLLEISEALQYNFFKEIAHDLPYQEPDYDQKVDADAVKAPLLTQIRDLQMEVSILRQTLKDITTK
jgi:hypothetical protein